MRRAPWIGAAAAAVAVCAAIVLVPRTISGTPAPLPASCPQRWDSDKIGNWVPGAADLDGVADSLVPGTPDSALVCAYPGTNTDPGGEPLAGSRTLTGEAGKMAFDLGYLPVTTDRPERACTLMGGPMTNYLIRFAYSDGQALWVGTAEEANSCVTTTNGTTMTTSRIGPSVTAAYRTGTWRLLPPKNPCDPGTGRRGQDAQLVPEGPTTVMICRMDTTTGPTPTPLPVREHGERQARDLASALNALDAEPHGNTCKGGGPRHETLRLHFGYAEGPPAWVQILAHCRPAVSNGLLAGDLDDALLDRILQLS